MELPDSETPIRKRILSNQETSLPAEQTNKILRAKEVAPSIATAPHTEAPLA
jgi:hypothetical protein